MPSRSVAEHKRQAPQSVRCFIVTVSDTCTEETDSSGRAIADLLGAAGHEVAGRAIVRDDAALVRSAIERQLARSDVRGRHQHGAAAQILRAYFLEGRTTVS